MTASWVQTLVLAAISGALPYVQVLASGGKVSMQTFLWSVILAVITAIANLFRSPLQNPPTMIAPKDDSGK